MAHQVEIKDGIKYCVLCGLSDFSEACAFSVKNEEFRIEKEKVQIEKEKVQIEKEKVHNEKQKILAGIRYRLLKYYHYLIDLQCLCSTVFLFSFLGFTLLLLTVLIIYFGLDGIKNGFDELKREFLKMTIECNKSGWLGVMRRFFSRKKSVLFSSKSFIFHKSINNVCAVLVIALPCIRKLYRVVQKVV